MEAKIFKQKNDERIVEFLYIDGELPDIKEFDNITDIQALAIKNITDSQKLQEFLQNIPKGKIMILEIVSCNMQDVDPRIFAQLQSVGKIWIEKSQGINYNELLTQIQNKQKILYLYFWNDRQDGGNISLERLREFKNLTRLALGNFNGISVEELHEYLLNAQSLEEVTVERNFQDLAFMEGINPNLTITLLDRKFDISLITSDIAKSHNLFRIECETGYILTSSTKGGYKVSFSADFLKRMDEIQGLIDGAEMSETIKALSIDDINEIFILIQDRNILKYLSGIFKIRVPHIGVISAGEIARIKKVLPELKDIVVKSPYEEHHDEAYQYTIEQYEILYNEIQAIVGDIPQNLTDLQKFMIIYQRLGLTIRYDYKLVKEEKRELEEVGYKSEYVKENQVTGRNLVNGLIKKQCVCAGYADILYNCLKTVGIEACIIGGQKHAWNKVKIDGVWYNVDLTNDCNAILSKGAQKLEKCLSSDEEFEKRSRQESGKRVPSNINYPRDEIAKAFEDAMVFDKREVALDAEFEVVAEEPSFFDKLKDRMISLFWKREKTKTLPKESSTVTAMAEKRRVWTENLEIPLDNLEKTTRVKPEKSIATVKPKDREPGDN